MRKILYFNTNYQHSQAGFAMPLAIGLGLVMIIVAASTIGRSQSDRAITSNQRETNRALSISEAGIIRVQSFLDRHQILATKNLSQWSNTLNSLSTPQASCNSIDIISAKALAVLLTSHAWIALDNTNPNKGRYKVIDYRYQNGVGKLTLAGAIDAYNTTQNSSLSSLTVTIPIGSESAKIAPPALWANTFKLSPIHKITGKIQSVSCSLPPLTDPDGIIGVDASNIALISGVPSGQIIADIFTPIPVPKIAPATAISLPAITNSIILPRPSSGDLPDANGEYHYVVDLDNPSSGYSIKLHDLDFIKVNLGVNQKVNLYLKGNIDLAGSKTIDVNAIHPNLRLYGSVQTTKLIVKDTASITAFIHAPSADAKSISSSPPNPSKNITGAVWVNSWDSLTIPNDLPIVGAGNWLDFGIAKSEQPAQISPISYWQRVGN